METRLDPAALARPVRSYPCERCGVPQQMAEGRYGPLICGPCLHTHGWDADAALAAARRPMVVPIFGARARRSA